MHKTGKSNSAWKMNYFRDFVANHSGFIPVISITESWCKSYHSDAQIKVDGYNSFRSDRKKRARGGCLVYVHEDIIVSDFKTFDNEYCEVVCLSMPECKKLFFTVYRPPHCPDNKFLDTLRWIREQFCSIDHSWTKIISGDFNFPEIDWETVSVGGSDVSATSFIEFLICSGLEQFVHKPTRTSKTGTANVLDLFITDDSELVLDVSCENTMVSDHDIVHVSLNTDFNPLKKSTGVTNYSSFGMFDFNAADYDRISDYLNNVDWSALQAENPLEFPVAFNKVVFNICQLCVPYKLSANGSGVNPKRKLKCIQGLKRKKKKLLARIHAIECFHPGSATLSKLAEKVSSIDCDIKQRILDFNARLESSAVSKIKSNPRYFYSYVKKKSSARSKVGPLKTSSNQFVSHSKQMADVLQEQFCSVFSDPDNVNIKPPEYDPVSCCLSDIEFTPSDIEWAIDQLKPTSASGMDEFPAFLLKGCKNSLSYPIYLIWRYSYDNGLINESFLTQLIAPVFKKGSRFDPANYRPISLTSHIIKLFERVVQKKISSYLEENSLLNINQHGFRKGFSCLSELLAHFNDIIDNMSHGWRTDTIYLDFSKAFDKVDHNLLISKLQLLGISGKLLDWLKAFLRDRKQVVAVNGFYSIIELVLSGVPQGTVLGPLLFLIFVNDMSKVVKHSVLRLFADDSRLVKAITDDFDKSKLQEDLESVMFWSVSNNMVLHPDKFELLCHEPYLNNHAVKLFSNLPFACGYDDIAYTCNQMDIAPSHLVKDLGIIMTADFNFNAHINLISSKASLKVSWLLSAFKSRSSFVLMTLYKSLVRSLLEYCCPLWSPFSIHELQTLESVQRRLTSKIAGLERLDYWSRLQSLGLMSLQRRRERYILLYLWKILNCLVPNDLGIEWTFSDRLGFKVIIPNIPAQRIKIGVYDRFFKVSASKTWNTLPKWVNTESSSLLSFKHKLDEHLSHIPDRPPVQGYVTGNNNFLVEY